MSRLACAACALLFLGSVLAVQADDKTKRSPQELQEISRIQQLGGLVLQVAQNDPHLDVSYQQITGKFSDNDLAPLATLKGVVSLNLSGLDVTDASLDRLKGLTELTRLHLERTKITDKGLHDLEHLVNLEYLNLYGTNITDAGLVNLEGMKKLKHLYLWQTKVTDTGVARLKKSLPQVEVVRGFDAPVEPPKKATPKKPDAKASTKKPEKKSK